MSLHLPTVNASLNLICTLILLRGGWAARQGNRQAHTRAMVAALITSTLFLSCYLYYHFTAQMMTPYTGKGWMRYLYFFILVTHIPLAGVIVPGCATAVYFALTNQIERHRRVTRWLWPTWLYVSITGVLIYLMLYL